MAETGEGQKRPSPESFLNLCGEFHYDLRLAPAGRKSSDQAQRAFVRLERKPDREPNLAVKPAEVMIFV
jgi:hypothetical protein